MSIYGKVIGFIIGLALLKLPGAIIGLIAGHFFDLVYGKDFSNKGGFARFFSNEADIQRQAVFFHALFSALGHISKADGKVTDEEIAVASALMDNMRLSGDTRREAQQAFRDGKAKDFPLDSMLKEFKQYCHGRRDLMQVYLEILISAACADGHISPPELVILETVAANLGFQRKDLHFLISSYAAQQRFRQANQGWQGTNQRAGKQGYSHRGHQGFNSDANQLQDAYKILGANEKDDDRTIKRAYKRQMSLHHPDKLSAKGLPEQALEMAKSKTQDIQAAYELIKQKRGF